MQGQPLFSAKEMNLNNNYEINLVSWYQILNITDCGNFVKEMVHALTVCLSSKPKELQNCSQKYFNLLITFLSNIYSSFVLKQHTIIYTCMHTSKYNITHIIYIHIIISQRLSNGILNSQLSTTAKNKS